MGFIKKNNYRISQYLYQSYEIWNVTLENETLQHVYDAFVVTLHCLYSLYIN